MAGGRDILVREECAGGGDRFGMHAAIPGFQLVGRQGRVIHLGLRDARANRLCGVQRGVPPQQDAFVGAPLVGRLPADQEMGASGVFAKRSSWTVNKPAATRA